MDNNCKRHRQSFREVHGDCVSCAFHPPCDCSLVEREREDEQCTCKPNLYDIYMTDEKAP